MFHFPCIATTHVKKKQLLTCPVCASQFGLTNQTRLDEPLVSPISLAHFNQNHLQSNVQTTLSLEATVSAVSRGYALLMKVKAPPFAAEVARRPPVDLDAVMSGTALAIVRALRDISYNQIMGEIPYNIGFLQVATLSLQGNKLTGKIPEVIGLMQPLAVLNLSKNNFKGRIPTELVHIINLDTLDLSDNNFSGPVSVSVGDLEHLLTLNFSRNHLHGPLPAEFGNLKSIEIMDIVIQQPLGWHSC